MLKSDDSIWNTRWAQGYSTRYRLHNTLKKSCHLVAKL